MRCKQVCTYRKITGIPGVDLKRNEKGHSQNHKLVSIIHNQIRSLWVTIQIPRSTEGCDVLQYITGSWVRGRNTTTSLFLGQSTGDIRHKLQKLHPTESRNLEVLLDEEWRVFSNREEKYKRGQKRVVAVAREQGERKPRWGQPRLGRDQCALCKRFGHWKDECLRKKRTK